MWDKTIGGIEIDELKILQQTTDGGYVLGGNSFSGIGGDKSQPAQSEDFWIVKLNSNGVKIWDKTLGGNDPDRLASLQQTSDGGFIFGGYSYSNVSGDKSQPSQGASDYWIVKLAADVTGISEASLNSQLSIFPNPNQGKFNLQLENIAASKAEVSISDLLGRIVLQKELPVTNKQVSEELEIKAAKGLYLLQIKAGNQTTSRKIVVE